MRSSCPNLLSAGGDYENLLLCLANTFIYYDLIHNSDNCQLKSPPLCLLTTHATHGDKATPQGFQQKTCGTLVSSCSVASAASWLASQHNEQLRIWQNESPQTSSAPPWPLCRAPRKNWGRPPSFLRSPASLQNENSHPETSATVATSPQFWGGRWEDTPTLLRQLMLRTLSDALNGIKSARTSNCCAEQ